jgi:hypothetical protein
MSTINADTHLFGSRRGYECLGKAPGVTAAEDRALSEFGFGQSSDDRFLKGLVGAPTAYARALPGGRMGITRVLAGPLDDSGRPTLERRTIVVSVREYLVLRRGMRQLLADNRVWAAGEFGAGRRISVPVPAGAAERPSEQVWRVFDAWFSARERPPHGVVVGATDQSASEILDTLACLADADAADFSWGVRLLSPITWVDVMSISQFGAMDGRRQVFGVSRSSCVNPAVESARRGSPGRLPALNELRGIAVSGADEPSAPRRPSVPRRPAATSQPTQPRAPAKVVLWVAACTIALALGVIGLIVFRGGSGSPGSGEGFASNGGNSGLLGQTGSLSTSSTDALKPGPPTSGESADKSSQAPDAPAKGTTSQPARKGEDADKNVDEPKQDDARVDPPKSDAPATPEPPAGAKGTPVPAVTPVPAPQPPHGQGGAGDSTTSTPEPAPAAPAAPAGTANVSRPSLSLSESDKRQVDNAIEWHARVLDVIKVIETVKSLDAYVASKSDTFRKKHETQCDEMKDFLTRCDSDLFGCIECGKALASPIGQICPIENKDAGTVEKREVSKYWRQLLKDAQALTAESPDSDQLSVAVRMLKLALFVDVQTRVSRSAEQEPKGLHTSLGKRLEPILRWPGWDKACPLPLHSSVEDLFGPLGKKFPEMPKGSFFDSVGRRWNSWKSWGLSDEEWSDWASLLRKAKSAKEVSGHDVLNALEGLPPFSVREQLAEIETVKRKLNG